jgi:hypothetical protein
LLPPPLAPLAVLVQECLRSGRVPIPCLVCGTDPAAHTIPVSFLVAAGLITPEQERRLVKEELRALGIVLVHCPVCSDAFDASDLPVRDRDTRGGQALQCTNPACHTRFCRVCLRPPHPRLSCNGVDEAARGARDRAHAARDVAAAFGGPLQAGAQRRHCTCPCGEVIERSAGCNHMQHPRCPRALRNGTGGGTTHFCFCCFTELDPNRTTHDLAGTLHLAAGFFQPCVRGFTAALLPAPAGAGAGRGAYNGLDADAGGGGWGDEEEAAVLAAMEEAEMGATRGAGGGGMHANAVLPDGMGARLCALAQRVYGH